MNGLKYNMGTADASAVVWKAGIYCRLSKDDDLQGESASISNQREFLTGYCRSNGWDVVSVYQDDGFTGLNQDRPDLKRMLGDAEKGKINLLLCKDLSRIGRNYLETGYLMDNFFPRYGIRFIAVNDGIDTLRENNEILPFKNILNEMFSKDIGSKVHTAYMVKAQKGEFTGCLAPLGYKKDPADRHHLLIDEDTAWIIRKIFGYAADGNGSNYIRRRLEDEKIPCPTWWNRQKGLRNKVTKWEKKDSENGRYIWDFTVIEEILQNPVYYGAISSQKCHYRFKLGVIGDKPPQEWIVVEGMHEPIVDKATFDIVQGKIRRRQHPVNEELSLFSGLIRCGECGKALTVRNTNAKVPRRIYSCVTYNKFGSHHCTQHSVDQQELYDIVLNKIRFLASAALSDEEAVLKRIGDADGGDPDRKREELRHGVIKAKDRLSLLEKMVSRLYEDMLSGKITEENFLSLLEKTQKEQAELKEQLLRDEARMADSGQEEKDSRAWRELIRGYADIKELDRPALNRLVREIVIHEEITGGHEKRKKKRRNLTIEIHFNFKPLPEVMEKRNFQS